MRTPILLLTLATLACGQAAARGAGSIPRPPPTPAAAIPSAPVSDVRPAAGPPAVAVEARMVLVAGGDVELGRAMGKVLLRTPTHDPFATVASIFASGDVRFVNLESQLSEQGGETMSPRNSLVFTGPPGGADTLARAHVTIVSTANNHAWDYGKRAFLETLDNLDRVNVLHVGTGRTLAEAVRPVIVERGGFRAAFLAVTDMWNLGPLEKHVARDFVARADGEWLAAQVAELKKDSTIDGILVSYHGGDEYQDAPTLRTRAILRAAIDAGADAVLGHHVHVVQGIEWRRGRPILYSMGNLLMQRHRDYPATGYGYLARITLSRGAPPRLEACPYRIVGLVPFPFVGDPGRRVYEAELFGRLRSTSALLGRPPSIGKSGVDGCAEVLAPSG